MVASSQYVYRSGQVRKLKEGINIKDYLTKHPDAIPVGKPPSVATLEKWENERGGCKALDGCWVEPDGRCPHGLPSWMLALGYI